MTNFEKWRQELTPESFNIDGLVDIECENCPAYGSCRFGEYGISCWDGFIEWAEMEVE